MNLLPPALALGSVVLGFRDRARWMGMSVAILARHYAKVRDRHVQKAIQNDVRLLARATQPDVSDPASDGIDPMNNGPKGLTSGLKSDAR